MNQIILFSFCQPTDPIFFAILPVNQKINLVSPKYIIFMLYFPRMDNPILILHPKYDVCWLCEQHFQNKEQLSTITSVGFKTLKEYAKKWTAVGKVPSSFQNFYLILDNCNTITAVLLENKTVKSHP